MRKQSAAAVSRRAFLSMAIAGLTWPQAGLNQGSNSGLTVRAKRPEDLEMTDAGFTDIVTPVDRFFVRTHVAVPNVDIATWRLKLDGHVSTPLTFSLDELRRLPAFELPAVLECAGNGRSFYEPSVAGLQWTNGAVGNGKWKGVRLRDLLQRAGAKDGAVEILFDGADVPIGSMPDFQRSIPLKKALEPTTLLAFEMNGGMLPVKHGFPVRAVVPGWAGNSWVKWVTNIRVLNEPSNGFWMKNAYLYPARPVAPGSAPPAEIMKPVTSLRVKSIIAAPGNESVVEVGKPASITGAAWTGDSGRVVRVDVSTDSGRTWNAARLGGEPTGFGWRLWSFSWTPTREGYYTVLSRARDSSGDVQPLVAEWNPSGYLFNAVGRVDLTAGTQAGAVTAIPSAANALPQPQGFRETCLICHDEDVIRQQRLTRAQWDREITKMTGWGARVESERRETLLDYLLGIAGPRR
jgi:DMSO/TMAO reductase YedYZ molybdopterin-dependent catalytic subunit